MTDKVTVRRIRNGESDKKDELAEKYYPDVYRYCVYRTGSMLDAEDLTQETFLRLFRYFDSYDEMQKIKSYILTIASHICTDYLTRHQSNAVLDENIASAGLDISTDKMLVRRAVASLPDDMREAVVLYYYNGMKIREIADLLKIPLSTVKTRLSRGRSRLKQHLITAGFH